MTTFLFLHHSPSSSLFISNNQQRRVSPVSCKKHSVTGLLPQILISHINDRHMTLKFIKLIRQLEELLLLQILSKKQWCQDFELCCFHPVCLIVYDKRFNATNFLATEGIRKAEKELLSIYYSSIL